MIIILNGLTPVTFKQIDEEAEKWANGGIEWDDDQSSEGVEPPVELYSEAIEESEQS